MRRFARLSTNGGLNRAPKICSLNSYPVQFVRRAWFGIEAWHDVRRGHLKSSCWYLLLVASRLLSKCRPLAKKKGGR